MINFSIRELCESDTAQRMGIDNSTPPPGVLQNLYLTQVGMERVRSLLGDHPIQVTSGFRCEALEKVLTAKDYASWCSRRGLTKDDASWKQYFAGKAHPKGYAVDFKCPGFGRPLDIVRLLAKSDLKFDQCIEEGTWAHISFDPKGRKQVLSANFGADGTPTYTAGVA